MADILKRSLQILAGGTIQAGKEYFDNVVQLKTDAVELQSSLIGGVKTGVETFRRLRNQPGGILRKISNWFYQRGGEYDQFSLDGGDNGDDFDAGFDMGGDDVDENEGSPSIDVKSAKNIARGQIGAMYQIGGKQVEASIANTAEIISSLNSRSCEITASINNLNKTMLSLNDKVDKLVNAVVQQHSEKNEREISTGIIDSSGNVTLGSVGAAVSNKLKENTVVQTASMVLDQLKGGQLSPEAIASIGVNMLLDEINVGKKSIGEHLTTINDSIGAWTQNLLTTLTKSSPFQWLFGDINGSGYRSDYQSYVKNTYTKEKAVFDGITRKTIIDIIPGYLREMTHALTGIRYNIDSKGRLTTKNEDVFLETTKKGTTKFSAISYDADKRIEDTLGTNYDKKELRLVKEMLTSGYVFAAYFTGDRAFTFAEMMPGSDLYKKAVFLAYEGYKKSGKGGIQDQQAFNSLCEIIIAQQFSDASGLGVESKEFVSEIQSRAASLEKNYIELARSDRGQYVRKLRERDVINAMSSSAQERNVDVNANLGQEDLNEIQRRLEERRRSIERSSGALISSDSEFTEFRKRAQRADSSKTIEQIRDEFLAKYEESLREKIARENFNEQSHITSFDSTEFQGNSVGSIVSEILDILKNKSIKVNVINDPLKVKMVTDPQPQQSVILLSGTPGARGDYDPLGMSMSGCGPTALSDLFNRRNGLDPTSLARNMAMMGLYSPNGGTTVGGYMTAANGLGIPMYPTNPNQSMFNAASPFNPVTLFGSGSTYRTRPGNFHFMNLLGTSGSTAIVSNPMYGGIHRYPIGSIKNDTIMGLRGYGPNGDNQPGDVLTDVSDTLTNTINSGRDWLVDLSQRLAADPESLLGAIVRSTGVTPTNIEDYAEVVKNRTSRRIGTIGGIMNFLTNGRVAIRDSIQNIGSGLSADIRQKLDDHGLNVRTRNQLAAVGKEFSTEIGERTKKGVEEGKISQRDQELAKEALALMQAALADGDGKADLAVINKVINKIHDKDLRTDLFTNIRRLVQASQQKLEHPAKSKLGKILFWGWGMLKKVAAPVFKAIKTTFSFFTGIIRKHGMNIIKFFARPFLWGAGMAASGAKDIFTGITGIGNKRNVYDNKGNVIDTYHDGFIPNAIRGAVDIGKAGMQAIGEIPLVKRAKQLPEYLRSQARGYLANSFIGGRIQRRIDFGKALAQGTWQGVSSFAKDIIAPGALSIPKLFYDEGRQEIKEDLQRRGRMIKKAFGKGGEISQVRDKLHGFRAEMNDELVERFQDRSKNAQTLKGKLGYGALAGLVGLSYKEGREKITNKILEGFKNTFKKIDNWSHGIFGKIGKGVSTVGKFIGKSFKNVFTGIGSGIGKFTSNMFKKLKDSAFGQWLGGKVQKAGAAVKKIGEKLKSGNLVKKFKESEFGKRFTSSFTESMKRGHGFGKSLFDKAFGGKSSKEAKTASDDNTNTMIEMFQSQSSGMPGGGKKSIFSDINNSIMKLIGMKEKEEEEKRKEQEEQNEQKEEENSGNEENGGKEEEGDSGKANSEENDKDISSSGSKDESKDAEKNTGSNIELKGNSSDESKSDEQSHSFSFGGNKTSQMTQAQAMDDQAAADTAPVNAKGIMGGKSNKTSIAPKGAMNKVGGKVGGVFGKIGKVIASIKKAIINLGGPLGRIVAGILKLVGGVASAVAALKGFQLISKAVTRMFKQIAAPLASTAMKIYAAVKPVLNAIRDIFKIITKTIAKTLNALLGLIKPALDVLLPIVTTIIDMLGDVIGTITDTLVKKILVPILGLIEKLLPIVEFIGAVLKTILGFVQLGIGVLETGFGYLMLGIGRLASIFSRSIGGAIIESAEASVADGKSNMQAGWQNMKEGYRESIQSLGNFAKGLIPGGDDGKLKSSTSEVDDRYAIGTGSSVMDGITTNNDYSSNTVDNSSVTESNITNIYGSGDAQSNYGSYLGMRERGCGPIALADAYSRRTGNSISPYSLAASMTGAGNYSSSRGTSVSGFMNTGHALGMGMTAGGVTNTSLRNASPSNPITVVGSGGAFGTRSGNTHYMNVIGSDGRGHSYVSNPMRGGISKVSSSDIVNSSLMGIYGSGDISTDPYTMSQQIGLPDSIATAIDELKTFAKDFFSMFTGENSVDTELKKQTQQNQIDRARRELGDEEFKKVEDEAYELFKKERPKLANESDAAYKGRWNRAKQQYLTKAAAAALNKKVETSTANTKQVLDTLEKYSEDAAKAFSDAANDTALLDEAAAEYEDKFGTKQIAEKLSQMGMGASAGGVYGNGTVIGLNFTPRLTAPEAGNKYYQLASRGGYNSIDPNPPKGGPIGDLSALPNCSGYALGRFHEEINDTGFKYLPRKYGTRNGGWWVENAKAAGMDQYIDTSGTDPHPGDAISWKQGGAAGHVAIVEEVPDPDHITISHSAWGGFQGGSGTERYFQLKKIERGNASDPWKIWNGYNFAGFIHNPEIQIGYGTGVGASQGILPFTDIMNQYNWFKGHQAEFEASNYHQEAVQAGLTPAQEAYVAGVGIVEDGAKKLIGKKSLTRITHDCNGQAAFGISNWIPKNPVNGEDYTYGSTLHEQLQKGFAAQYFGDNPTRDRARVTSNLSGYSGALAQVIGYAPKLGKGELWGKYLDTDLLEGTGHGVGNAVVPGEWNQARGLAKYIGSAAGYYNWLIDKGYVSAGGNTAFAVEGNYAAGQAAMASTANNRLSSAVQTGAAETARQNSNRQAISAANGQWVNYKPTGTNGYYDFYNNQGALLFKAWDAYGQGSQATNEFSKRYPNKRAVTTNNYTGKLPKNAIMWAYEFDTTPAALRALELMGGDITPWVGGSYGSSTVSTSSNSKAWDVGKGGTAVNDSTAQLIDQLSKVYVVDENENRIWKGTLSKENMTHWGKKDFKNVMDPLLNIYGKYNKEGATYLAHEVPNKNTSFYTSDRKVHWSPGVFYKSSDYRDMGRKSQWQNWYNNYLEGRGDTAAIEIPPINDNLIEDYINTYSTPIQYQPTPITTIQPNYGDTKRDRLTELLNHTYNVRSDSIEALLEEMLGEVRKRDNSSLSELINGTRSQQQEPKPMFNDEIPVGIQSLMRG